MEPYTIKLIKSENPIIGFFVNKTIKAIGHEPLNARKPSEDPFMLIITKNMEEVILYKKQKMFKRKVMIKTMQKK